MSRESTDLRDLPDRCPFYSAIIVFFFVNFALMWSPLVTPHYNHYLLVNIYTAFANIMACRVLRNVALGTDETQSSRPGLSTTAIAVAFQLEPL